MDNNKMVVCSDCGGYHPCEDMIHINASDGGYYICKDCLNDCDYAMCGDCGNWFYIDDMEYNTGEGHYYCKDCNRGHKVIANVDRPKRIVYIVPEGDTEYRKTENNVIIEYKSESDVLDYFKCARRMMPDEIIFKSKLIW